MQELCGVWSQKSEHEAISVTIHKVWRGPAAQMGPVVDGFYTWNCISYDDMTLLVLTNTNAHIWYKSKEFWIQQTEMKNLC